jgi:hypothetical protein
MPFKKGQRHPNQGGKRGGGRPTKEQARQKKLEQETADSIIKKNSAKLARRLVSDAMTEKGRKSLHVAINKLVPDAKVEQMEAAQPLQINFLQFGNNTPQLPAREIPVAIEQPVPQENRLIERQALKFYDFAKRRDNEGASGQ